MDAGRDTVRVGPPLVDGFEQLELIGAGGFCSVYRAHEIVFDREVALKVLEAAGTRVSDLFQRECRAAGKLSWHDNVVSVLSTARTADGRPYLKMQYVPGGSLMDRIRAGKDDSTAWYAMPWQEVLSVGVQVCSALAAAHAAGMLHRDVKPANVLQDGERVKLTDFGIAGAMVAAQDDAGPSDTGYDYLSPGFASPEAVGRSETVDHLSDLYSLGATLEVLLTGLPRPRARTQLQTLDVPVELVELIASLTEVRKADRPQSAVSAGTAMQEIQRTHGLRVDQIVVTQPSGQTRFNAPPTATASEGFRRAGRARSLDWAAPAPIDERPDDTRFLPQRTEEMIRSERDEEAPSEPLPQTPAVDAPAPMDHRVKWDAGEVRQRDRWGRSADGSAAGGPAEQPSWLRPDAHDAVEVPAEPDGVRRTTRRYVVGLTAFVIAAITVIEMLINR